MINWLKKEKSLLQTRKRRLYDLPLAKSEDTKFLTLLIGLMSFLGFVILCLSFVLNDMTARWSSGLENKLTVEIPVESASGGMRSNEDISAQEENIKSALLHHDFVKEVTILKRKDISDLVEPWLGEDLNSIDITLPGLISLTLRNETPETLKTLTREITNIEPQARLDTHEDWLGSILRLAGGLKYGSLLISLIIVATTIIAIAGGIKSRMAVYKEQVELLHIMGATDTYIMRQFQRHALIITLLGSLCGTMAAVIFTFLIHVISGDSAEAFLPDFTLKTVHIIMLGLIPIFAASVSYITARLTVMATLKEMP